MKISREIKTAILVISSILLFIWGYSFLKGRDLLSNYRTFYVHYDNVEGLSASAAVTINGLVVGKVEKIEFMDKLGKLQVEMQIKSDFPISKSSVAALYEPGLIAGKQIQIIPNYEDQTPAQSGDVLPGKVIPGLTALVGEKLEPLQQDLDKVLKNADQLLGNVNEVLDKESKANLRKAIAELRITMEEFHKASGSLNGILDENKQKIDGIVTNFNKVSKDFSSISDSLNKADLGKTAKKLQATLDNVDKIIAGIESGNGTMGKLMKDDKLYKELAAASNELELLLQDVRLNPTRYVNISVFGKKNKPYVAPINDTIKP
ncbi:MlaD family protein [Flavobacterium caeni]|uniref:Phospholipid/cholesterol/gamma-HCH transport system substrate-binding protein n=1 Tax=Flavobacterium caeni TaxID=490189 RepID=A0A1G5DBS6_9FLAO|nr:MlaD family protein [Flavobacterium caeni]SCY12064.1 phospholipid/cholesterol/gamma-HCH transport system substrate-binding protein [Flavobacterium caeni]